MHNIITTHGIVLGKRGFGEANTSAAMLTREFGIIRVGARSARLERSKLRYGLETLTSGRFALVRGKYEWKLTGAFNLGRDFVGASVARTRAAGRIARLLLRLIHGEEAVVELYTSVERGFAYLAKAASEEEIEQVEWLLVLRILSHLGYVEHGGALAPFVQDDELSHELTARARAMRPLLLRTINESLSATGL